MLLPAFRAASIIVSLGFFGGFEIPAGVQQPFLTLMFDVNTLPSPPPEICASGGLIFVSGLAEQGE